jgi:hypothetical protein
MSADRLNPSSAADASPLSPARLWKRMPTEQRFEVAGVFWADKEATAQHLDAMAEIARRLKFRAKTVQGLSLEKKAHYLASLPISDALASYVLIAYHLAARRPLMGAFLDALGIAHENGVLAGDRVPPPDQRRLAEAAAKVLAEYPAQDVELYLRTLLAQDPETWGALAETIEPALEAAARKTSGAASGPK